MMHKGVRTTGGNMSAGLQDRVDALLDEFGECVRRMSVERKLQRAVVRSLLPCSVLAILDKEHVFIIGQRHFGMPSSHFIFRPDLLLTPEQAEHSARWEFGFEDPFSIVFPKELLDEDGGQRLKAVEAVALAHVDSEFQRVLTMTSLIQVTPLFGPASYALDHRLAFVLMPFSEELTTVYSSIVKPTVEEMGLVCRRADDFKTNKAIIQDIWKAICEARVVIADLTGLNPNVMYELGIAHTVGKQTILMYQRRQNRRPAFPFDLAHIRRIEYDNTASGGKVLESDLRETLYSILQRTEVS